MSIDINDTAQLLDISTATVRNWIKFKYLTPIKSSGRPVFDLAKIKQLKSRIEKGEFNRLTNRANKSTSTRYFIPQEYLENKIAITSIEQIVRFIQENRLDTNNSLFLLAIKHLMQSKLIKNVSISEILNFKFEAVENNILKDQLQDWYNSLHNFNLTKSYIELFNFKVPNQKDIIGLLYQSLLLESTKSKNGSYYTPKNIVDDIVADYAKPNSKILDPCCGTGQFLLSVSQKIQNTDNIYGYDIDPNAIRIARINLILENKNNQQRKKINIFQKDSILSKQKNNLPMKFDLIITNPPWGSHFKSETMKRLIKQFPLIKSKESFSYFLHKSIDLLSNEGILSFILPVSILNVKIHKDIRKYILQNTSILKIVYLDRIFKNVFTPVIRLDLQKLKCKDHTFSVIKNNTQYTQEQNRFLNNQDYLFDIDQNELDRKIISKIYKAKHTTLKNNADWALGIVTGNNQKFIKSVSKNYYEKIYTGKEVLKYIFKEPIRYLKFDPNQFQQVAPEFKYRTKEKLIYKFISKKLVFAYDNQQKLTLNSANIVIPKIKNYPIKVILALFNSDLYQFLFQKKFSSIKVLRSHLEQLPLPIWNNNTYDKITALVDDILNENISDLSLNEFIMDKFKLTQKEKKHINELKRG